ncbi:MAG: putative exported protein [Candidatus Angelobacter sp.]|nr:putative exported protein [Candidatus Angelobacter sp.]
MNPANGITTKPASCTVEEAVNKIKSLLVGRGINLFAVIDHSDEAAAIGMKMPNTKLLIFGNPKGGTPLMLASPSIAIDLPLKLLVAEDANGRCSISYNSPQYLQERHGIPNDLIKNIAIIEALAAEAAA